LEAIMRWAILSDVHGNLQALESVLSALRDGDSVDGCVFLGDAVGYGADPNACVETLRETCSQWVVGNHDHGVIELTNIGYFNHDARIAIQWCRDHLTQDHRSFLKSLPLVLVVEDFLCVHATPQNPEDWNYIFTMRDAEEAFEALNLDLCFLGHSHIPFALSLDVEGEINVLDPQELIMRPDDRHLINPGSIGQPRDGDPRAAFGIYDSSERAFRLQRVPYDVHSAAQRIIDAGLPKSLANRLHLGI
jgi:diadenosine tetraphosphatase ApaH/serine/threonine PP2A family protein phosphatase